jgi:transcription elongation factor GreA
MTDRSTRREALIARLAALEAERVEVLSHLSVPHCGDDADRAANVDEQARLDLVERRIGDVHQQLARISEAAADAATVRPGDLVTVDLGDGLETFRYGSVDEADDRHDVVTPNSPLGEALRGAAIGSDLTYEVGRRRHRVRVVDLQRAGAD